MSETGRTRDAGWQIGVSRTVDHPVEQVWDFLTSDRGSTLWLGEGISISPTRGERLAAPTGWTGETRGYQTGERIRLAVRPPGWDHETIIQVVLRPSGHERTSIRFHQEKLSDASERTRQRDHWQGVLNRLVTALDEL